MTRETALETAIAALGQLASIGNDEAEQARAVLDRILTQLIRRRCRRAIRHEARAAIAKANSTEKE